MARARRPGPARGDTAELWAGVAGRASRQAHGVPVELLDGYLADLDEVSASGRPSGPDRLRVRHDVGARAAAQGVPLRGVIDMYLSATWLAWPLLSGVRRARNPDVLRELGEAVFKAADAAVMAVAEGYEKAQRWSVRQEESFRREFVDDLLDGRNLGQLAERAERFGLRLAGSNVVAAAHCPEPVVDGGEVARAVETSLHLRLDSRDVLITTKAGLLVCVVPDTMAGVLDEFTRQVAAALGDASTWWVGVGRAQSGPGGVVRSFEQARHALDIAERLALPGRVHRADDLLVYQVLLRDSAALADLVSVVLEPLREVRGGAGPLLATLSAYFAAGQVAAACARELQVGVRTVTYRLQRVRELTGYSVEDPSQALSLHVAVLGAKLLDWPPAAAP
ncbi:PucR family transcriptional regulator [Saccharothrix algeriensis]|uniref:Helix-turn-helix domain-containing protein n=1 Tax=Saccharothrix algeriensis TaxID=173560 RepID=A0A8T8HWC6_9PSEU|nr:helix-turn-helix domain-containing protein [Saccharothrix algeriensis]MBM7814619.1 sugar diacid utilization regulator [Saccharothrix algeriensis]QTR02905.1 helix-turn-helix domain-containing protein [Saccharothrix algeriensis]